MQRINLTTATDELAQLQMRGNSPTLSPVYVLRYSSLTWHVAAANAPRTPRGYSSHVHEQLRMPTSTHGQPYAWLWGMTQLRYPPKCNCETPAAEGSQSLHKYAYAHVNVRSNRDISIAICICICIHVRIRIYIRVRVRNYASTREARSGSWSK